MASLAVVLVALSGIGACGLLPHDGPSLSAVEDGASGKRGGYSLVELNARADAIVESTPRPALLGLGRVASSGRVDLVGVGDGLSVTIFERSPDSLFASGILSAGLDRTSPSLDRFAANNIPKLVVDRTGDIAVPYCGEVHVAGLTAAEAAQAIEISLKGKLVSPQVVVSIADNVANSVTVVGEVKNPGRYALFDGSDHILDVLAMAAGASRPPGDIRVEVVRGSLMASVSLAELLRDNSQNIRLAPRDQVRLVFTPRKFETFGALNHPTEIPIEDETLSLAGALSRAGGLDPGAANASAVLLFRFERPQVAAALSVRAPVSAKGVPIIYRLNLRNPEEFFVASRFQIQPDDLIYVPRANLTEVEQFIAVVNAASSVAYNIRVTTAVVP